MREIKFRGKSLDGKWLFGYIYRYVNRDGIDTVAIIEIANNGFDATLNLHKISHNTIGQFTGLHDSVGREIYEGDIMGLPENDANGVKYKNRYVRVVEWVNDGFFLLDYCTIGGEVRKYGDRLALEISLESNYEGIARCFQERGLDYTVIGNIHDNLELLKGK